MFLLVVGPVRRGGVVLRRCPLLPFPGRCLWLGLASSSAPFLQALSRFEFSGFWFVFVRHSVYSLGWRRDSGCSRLRMPALWWQKGRCRRLISGGWRGAWQGVSCWSFEKEKTSKTRLCTKNVFYCLFFVQDYFLFAGISLVSVLVLAPATHSIRT